MNSRIAELASSINNNTLALSQYLEENSLPFPSFDIDGPLDLKIRSPEIKQSQISAINALHELLDLLQGPVTCLMAHWNSAALRAIYVFDIDKKVPLDGMISYEDLAKTCGISAHDLQQIIRHAISYNHLFCEPQVGYVAHSAGSKALIDDDVLRAGFGMRFDFYQLAFNKTVDALIKHKDKEPSHTAFTLAAHTQDPLFQWLKSHPDRAQTFAKSMTALSRDSPGFSIDFLVNGYDWNSLGSGTVVDVGGSDGYVSSAIAKQNPSLNFVVQDLPNVIKDAETRGVNSEFPDRVKLQGHDFFTVQNVSADAYLFRWILHDWPDHYVEKALRNLVPALKPGARIILNESLCPTPGSLPVTLERAVRSIDIDMLALNNSRLRTVDEWKQIFKAADERFGDVKCVMPKGATLAILEVVWQPENDSGTEQVGKELRLHEV